MKTNFNLVLTIDKINASISNTQMKNHEQRTEQPISHIYSSFCILASKDWKGFGLWPSNPAVFGVGPGDSLSSLGPPQAEHFLLLVSLWGHQIGWSDTVQPRSLDHREAAERRCLESRFLDHSVLIATVFFFFLENLELKIDSWLKAFTLFLFGGIVLFCFLLVLGLLLLLFVCLFLQHQYFHLGRNL